MCRLCQTRCLALLWNALIFALVVNLPTYAAVAWSFNNLLMSGTKVGTAISESIAIGAEKALEECKRQFKWDRWNCPEWAFDNYFKNREYPANREMAFVRAIISAGIVHTLTRNCSNGELANCGCDRSRRGPIDDAETSSWGGCSDDIQYAKKLAEDILDSTENGKDPIAMVNLHNNALGRHAVQETMTMACKCHGVSGSCAKKTCWLHLAKFEIVGQYLKRSYRSALKIDSNHQKRQAVVSSEDAATQRSFGKSRLLYIEDSPDYCVANETEGLLGTTGRQCSRKRGKDVSPEERHSCRNLCRHCGLKVMKRRHQIQSPCNCKFRWCCEVKCDTCTQVNTIHTCQAASV